MNLICISHINASDHSKLAVAVFVNPLIGAWCQEQKVMRVVDGKLKVGNVKCNPATAETPKPDRVAYPMELKDLAGAVGQALSQLESSSVTLPTGIVNAPDFKTCGHTFRQYLDRHPH